MESLVSIIIPCYNGEQVVAEAIQSALDQSWSSTEVIVVNDGSTDQSLEVIESFGDKIRWETGPNRGGAAARNRGLQLARGEYIQFLDADDLLYPTKLERQVSILEKQSDCILTSVADLCLPGESVPTASWRPRHTESTRMAVFDPLTVSGPLQRRSHLDLVNGFREDLPCCQEKDLHIRLAMEGVKFQHLDEPLHLVRRTADSVSSNVLRVLRTMNTVLGDVIESLQSRGTLTNDWRLVLAEALAENGAALMRRRDFRHGKQSFKYSKKLHPSRGHGVFATKHRFLLRCLPPEIVFWLEGKLKGLLSPTAYS